MEVDLRYPSIRTCAVLRSPCPQPSTSAGPASPNIIIACPEGRNRPTGFPKQ